MGVVGPRPPEAALDRLLKPLGDLPERRRVCSARKACTASLRRSVEQGVEVVVLNDLRKANRWSTVTAIADPGGRTSRRPLPVRTRRSRVPVHNQTPAAALDRQRDAGDEEHRHLGHDGP
jgi:hypothetical protein